MMMKDRLPAGSSFFSNGATKWEQKNKNKGNFDKEADPATRCSVKGMVSYPCCPRETVIVFLNAHGQASIKCPRCGKFARFDYDRMTATTVCAYRGASQMYKTGK